MALPAYVEIAVNLGDPMFRGVYHEKQKHQDDLENVLQRATDAGVQAQILTAGALSETREVLAVAASRPGLYATAGCHPTRSTELVQHADGAAAYIDMLRKLVDANPGRIVAIGECGLGT